MTVRFYTEEFFEELARSLNEDEAWARSVRDVQLRFVCHAVDRGAFLLEIDRGRVTAEASRPDVPANYHFEGTYETWMSLCKGESEFDRLVEKNRIRVQGSLPGLMAFMGPLNHVVLAARRVPKEF